MAPRDYLYSKTETDIADSVSDEKLLRKSFEDLESCTDLSAIESDEGLDGSLTWSSRACKAVQQIQCRRRPLLLALGLLGLACAGLIASLRLTGYIGGKETRIMNLKQIEGDESIHWLNDPQPDGNLTNRTLFCGKTPRMARERGCVFDVMSFAWLPPDCVDFEMMERYIAERTWDWYSDYQMTNKLPLSVIRQGEYKWAFSTQSFHIAHCVYTWEKQGRFLFAPDREDEKFVDKGSFGHHHTTHCIDFILKRNLEPSKTSTIWNGVDECNVADGMGTFKVNRL